MADRLGRLLNPCPIAPSFVCFTLLDAPTPAPSPLTDHQQQVYLLVWCGSPSVASTGPIFKGCKIVDFIVLAYGCNDTRINQSKHVVMMQKVI